MDGKEKQVTRQILELTNPDYLVKSRPNRSNEIKSLKSCDKEMYTMNVSLKAKDNFSYIQRIEFKILGESDEPAPRLNRSAEEKEFKANQLNEVKRPRKSDDPVESQSISAEENEFKNQQRTELKSSNANEDLEQRQIGKNCPTHPKKILDINCQTCKNFICIMCFVETHKYHDCVDMDKYLAELKKEVADDRNEVLSVLKEAVDMKHRLALVEKDFKDSTDEAKIKIQKHCDELKELIDSHAQALHEDLRKAGEKKMQVFVKNVEELNEIIADLETLKKQCDEAESKQTEREIRQVMAEVYEKLKDAQVLWKKIAEREITHMKVSFKEAHLSHLSQRLCDDNVVAGRSENVVGRIGTTHIGLNNDNEPISRIQIYADVWGIAKLRGCIHVLCQTPTANSICVFKDNQTLELIERIRLKKILSPYDMVSSQEDNCLYISDKGNGCVWKIPSQNREIQWITGVNWPFTLSMTREGYLALLMSGQPSVLQLYNSEGYLVDKFLLPSIVQSPRHVVQTSDGDFLILHKCKGIITGTKMLWGVSRVSNNGKLLGRFTPDGKAEKMVEPTHLAVAADDRVYIADQGRDRVTLLSKNLTIIAILSVQSLPMILWAPRRLCYDATNSELLVGQEFGGVYWHVDN